MRLVAQQIVHKYVVLAEIRVVLHIQQRLLRQGKKLRLQEGHSAFGLCGQAARAGQLILRLAVAAVLIGVHGGVNQQPLQQPVHLHRLADGLARVLPHMTLPSGEGRHLRLRLLELAFKLGGAFNNTAQIPQITGIHIFACFGFLHGCNPPYPMLSMSL